VTPPPTANNGIFPKTGLISCSVFVTTSMIFPSAPPYLAGNVKSSLTWRRKIWRVTSSGRPSPRNGCSTSIRRERSSMRPKTGSQSRFSRRWNGLPPCVRTSRTGESRWCVITDTTAMAAACPETREELAGIYGIGTAKLEKYGATLLDLIRQYVRSHQTE